MSRWYSVRFGLTLSCVNVLIDSGDPTGTSVTELPFMSSIAYEVADRYVTSADVASWVRFLMMSVSKEFLHNNYWPIVSEHCASSQSI